MAVQEVNAVTRVKNETGEYIVYPATKAGNAAYDNTASSLTADDAQGAIDELAGRSYSKSETYSKSEVYSKTETYAKTEVYTKTETDQKITDAINTNITAALNASY